MARVGEAAWRDLLIAHNRAIRHQFNSYREREVATTGDGFLATFDSATRAARCGLGIVRSAQELGLLVRWAFTPGRSSWWEATRAAWRSTPLPE
ncbi:MAG TPA: hypothetical protein VK838_00195 [Candidatus Limnocylindrales bacterium]|nr:hypothetical protein [Candidatus Limnocylindrales bacterium]